jgi:hypothetical protein
LRGRLEQLRGRLSPTRPGPGSTRSSSTT